MRKHKLKKISVTSIDADEDDGEQLASQAKNQLNPLKQTSLKI